MKKFVGFGFGPIQAGLMMYEAVRSGNYDSFTVADVDQSLVDAVRSNHGSAVINIALKNGIASFVLSRINILNPAHAGDRGKLGQALFEADEIATAVPSVDFYDRGGDGSIARLLAAHVNPSKPQILYASENNNFAAEILREKIIRYVPQEKLSGFQILNTVIGKMSGVVKSAGDINRLGLATIVPGGDRAILVEEFNRIYVSKIRLPGYVKGIPVFQEKEDLLPFEEAKLFGHNAVHSLLGYLAARKGYAIMSRIREDRDLMAFGREAFLRESGAALIRKHRGLGDPLFTEAGYAAYADDLLERMTNPFLSDDVGRICRDPDRKLGYGDRIFGTMREALKQGIEPVRMAAGANAALIFLLKERDGALPRLPLDAETVGRELGRLWQGETDDGLMQKCVALTAGISR